MYYRLKSGFTLRGWQKLPYALCHLHHGEITALYKSDLEALSLCDGNTPVGPILTLPAYWKVIKIAEEMGYVEQCQKGDGILPDQKYRLCPSRYFKTAHWSVTGRCNYKCRHCYMSAPDAKYGELSHEQCMSIIDQLYECGVLNVTITGGEALVREDFWEIIDRLIVYGIRIETIYSNGKLITPEVLDALERRRIRPIISMSFDGVGWHDWLRGIPGAEEDVIRAFRLCQERGFGTTAEMCLHQRNKHTLRESINLLSSLGVLTLKTNPVSDSGEWLKNAGSDSLTMDELYEIYLDYLPQFIEDGAPIDIQMGGFFVARKGSKQFELPCVKYDGSSKAGKYAVCEHARTVMYIAADGRILPCMSLSGLEIQNEFPLVTEEGLIKCLSDSTYTRVISTTVDEFIKRNKECEECGFRYYCCSGCRASAYTEGGDFMGPDFPVCKLFKEGYIPRIFETAKGFECDNFTLEEYERIAGGK